MQDVSSNYYQELNSITIHHINNIIHINHINPISVSSQYLSIFTILAVLADLQTGPASTQIASTSLVLCHSCAAGGNMGNVHLKCPTVEKIWYISSGNHGGSNGSNGEPISGADWMDLKLELSWPHHSRTIECAGISPPAGSGWVYLEYIRRSWRSRFWKCLKYVWSLVNEIIHFRNYR